MSYTPNILLKNYVEKYRLKKINSSNPQVSVNWVYLAEDIENISFIKENQIIITTGLFITRGISLYDFLSALSDKNVAAVILNTGKYINDEDINEDIIKFSEEKNFSIYTMPWEIHISDITRDISEKLIEVKSHDEKLTAAFIDAIENREGYENTLREAEFYNRIKYRLVVLPYENTVLQGVLNQQIKSHIFTYNSNTVIIMEYNHNFKKIITEIKALSNASAVSSAKSGYKNIALLYNQCLDALKAGELIGEKHISYDDIGVLSLILAIKDKELLKNFYIKRLKIFEDYDAKHKTNLIDTLYYYIKTGGSQLDTAKYMYTHRNTIYYRINRIKELSGEPFDTQEKMFEYLAALYIRKIFLNKGEN